MPCGWLKYTHNDQCTTHVQEWSWVSVAGSADVVRGDDGVRESITSWSVLSSSSATSHFPVRRVFPSELIIVGREDTEIVRVVSCTTIVAVRVLEAPKVVEGGDLFQVKLRDEKKPQ